MDNGWPWRARSRVESLEDAALGDLLVGCDVTGIIRYTARVTVVARRIVFDDLGAMWRRSDGAGLSRPGLRVSVLRAKGGDPHGTP